MIYISQQMELRRRVQSRRLKIVGIGAGDGDTDTIARAEEVRGRQEVKRQLNGLAGRDRRQVAFVMAVVRQSQIIIWGLAQDSMGSSEIPFCDVRGISATINLFKVSEHIQIWGITP